MHHIAIMRKEWNMLEKIVSGEKTRESRRYMSRRAPGDRIAVGDVVYFKNSGELVSVKAEVAKVLQFENLNPQKVRKILDKYGQADGIEKKIC